jgi:Tol biopolymer transport system component
VSLAPGGTQANNASSSPAVSADGGYVAFTSSASNLVTGDTNRTNDVFVRELQTGATSRASVGSSGTQANDWSYKPSVSADGRYVAFASYASSLVPGDTNATNDIFVHDRQTGATSRVSVGPSGTQANHWSFGPSLSADGKYVAFESTATNLVPGISDGSSNVYLAMLR